MGLPDNTLNGKGKAAVEGGGRGSPTTLESTGLKVPPKSDEGTQTAPEEGRDRTEQEKPVPTPKEYEDRAWRWDERIQDYVAEEKGHVLRYTLYLKSRGNPEESVSVLHAPAREIIRSARSPGSPTDNGGSSENRPLSRRGSETSDFSDDELHSAPKLEGIPPPPEALPPGLRKKPWEFDLDQGFQIVEKPKRFFTVGRIFKTPWFEPHEAGIPARQSDLEWGKSRSAFYGSRPVAKFRWFVVVRKRLNHSLCFSITTFGGKGASKTRRGRAVDFVVLYSSDVNPPKPDEEEQITRKPIALILEGENQYISPLARLDCSRIYTVEDDLKVMKIGRVHPDSLSLLNEYFQESVA